MALVRAPMVTLQTGVLAESSSAREQANPSGAVKLFGGRSGFASNGDDRFSAFHAAVELRQPASFRHAKVRKCSAVRATVATLPAEAAEGSRESKVQPEGPRTGRPSPADLARTLMEVRGEGTLATTDAKGWPLATLVQFALDTEGRPVLRLDPGAVHTVHLERDSRCSLHVQLELPGKQKPQCTVTGRVCLPSDSLEKLKLETAWQRRYGKDMVIEEAEHSLCWIEVEKVLSCQDVGEEEVWVVANDYANAEADPLRDCAGKIVEDMNREHWEDIRRFCYSYAGVDEEIEEASMTWVDRLGFDLRVLMRSPQQIREIRVPFPREVKDDRDARSSIIMMAQVAWEHERHYIPPDIPLLGASTVL